MKPHFSFFLVFAFFFASAQKKDTVFRQPDCTKFHQAEKEKFDVLEKDFKKVNFSKLNKLIINHIDEENITHKQAFWVSVALIIWSVFALFRLFLNQWLYDYDRDIFSIIAYLFNIANITMYLFFIQGLRVINKKKIA